MIRSRHVVVLACLLCLVACGAVFLRDTVSAGPDMTKAGAAFVATLSAEQKSVAVAAFDDKSRVDWHFIPKDKRKGLQVKDMNAEQRKAAHALLRSALSQLGYDKATTIMSLEGLLRELEKGKTVASLRDPERYYFTLFGSPELKGKWGLSIEGHHLSLNFVVGEGRLISSTPTFYGANPAEVKTEIAGGPKVGTRVLAKEETLAFDLLKALNDDQRRSALIAPKAPADIRDAGKTHASSDPAAGLAAAKMSDEQKKLLRSLIEAYTANVTPDVAEARLAAIDKSGMDKLTFAWAGADRPGVGHYYRVEGPTFVIEFVNVQPDAEGNVANHIHSVWRDTAGDFGLPRQ